MTVRRLEILLASFCGVFSFIVYTLTLNPTVGFIDAGELATVALTLGIAHPTGYPLFTLLGHLFSLLPLGLRPIFQINLFTALLCALATFAFFRFSVFFIRMLTSGERPSQTKDRQTVSSRELFLVLMPALAGTLSLAFSETFWSQAVSVEVYSLHALLVPILLYLFLRGIEASKHPAADSTSRGARWWIFAFVLGLSFSNHMTTILFAPALLFLYFVTYRLEDGSIARLASMAIPFVLGLSLYLYLPIRASANPLLIWGNPVTLENLQWHMSGKVYQVWMAFTMQHASKQLAYFVGGLAPEFFYAPMALAVAGLLWLFRESRRAWLFTVLLFVGCVAYAINYDIHDIDSYFLLAYCTVGLWVVVGARAVLQRSFNSRWKLVIVVVILLMSLTPLVGNYARVDESDNTIVEQYTRDVFDSIAQDGIVLSFQWDYFVSASYYFQLVEDVRPDIVVIDKELLRRSWYYKQLQIHYPWLMAKIKPEVDALMVELYKFEHGLPYDGNTIEYRYAQVIRSIIEKNYAERPVYSTAEIEEQYLAGFRRIPSGLAARLDTGTDPSRVSPLRFNVRPPRRSDKYVDGILAQYAGAYVRNAAYLAALGQKTSAIAEVESALQVMPNNREAAMLLQVLKSRQ
jgi:hypothetical protein